MNITEVRIKLMDRSEDRLRGFCSITFDDSFVVRDLKIIEGNHGPFVAMPSRKLSGNCSSCRSKNHLRANYCNSCGTRLKSSQIAQDSAGRAKLYADIAHPINAACREMIQLRVVEELEKEVELSEQPGYLSRYDDDYLPDPETDANPAASEETTVPSMEDTSEIKSQRYDSAEDVLPPPHDPQSAEKSTPAGQIDDNEFGSGIFD